MDELADAVDSLKNLVARPGTFASWYPETTDDMVLAVLVDGLAECHLMGLLLDFESDDGGSIDADLSSGQGSMVVLFAAVRFMRAELFNRNTSVVYAAGTARYETTQATNILRDILKALEAQKNAIIEAIGSAGGQSEIGFFMADQYLSRAVWDRLYGYADPFAVGW